MQTILEFCRENFALRQAQREAAGLLWKEMSILAPATIVVVVALYLFA